MITLERLCELLTYDSLTGIFGWKETRGARKKGDRAGTVDARGYRFITIDRVRISAHRLAWLYIYKAWPSIIDHADGDRGNNKISNLRLATVSQNQTNSKCRVDNKYGLKGVRFIGGKWVAKIKVSGRQIQIGTYATPEAAHAAYATASIEHFGEFARRA